MIERDMLEITYTDLAKIEGYREVKHPWGETKLEKILLADNVPCSFNQNVRSFNSNQTQYSNEINYTAKLYCSPNIIVKAGDELTVTFEGVTRAFTAGEPFIYSSHQEIPLIKEGVA